MRQLRSVFTTLTLIVGMMALCVVIVSRFYNIESFFVFPVKQHLSQLKLSMTHDDVSGKTDVIGELENDHPEAAGDNKELVGKDNPRPPDTADSQWNQQTVHEEQAQTSDNWPVFSKKYFPGPIPRSPFHVNFTVTWDFDTTAFLQRPDVKGQPPKLMTWMLKPGHFPSLPEPVRLRVCPEMPCRMTTNRQYKNVSAALMWTGLFMRDSAPPLRSHQDQVFILYNYEPQKPDWTHRPSYRKPAWKSAINWTMTYRSDSDIVSVYGRIVKRQKPPEKNYTSILALKTNLTAQMTSHCQTFGQREKYVKQMQKHAPVDVYGGCSHRHCPRGSDDRCIKMLSSKYKFYLAFENAFCKDYISEKFFRYMDADFVVVARGSNDAYKNQAPAGTFINTADFRSAEELAKHLLYLDKHPEEYLKILQAKDQYQSLYEDWPIRSFPTGKIHFMSYHYESVAWCEACRRLWELEKYRSFIPDIAVWFDKHNCYPPNDLA